MPTERDWEARAWAINAAITLDTPDAVAERLIARELASAYAEGRAAGMEEAARRICRECAKGWPLDGEYHVEPAGTSSVAPLSSEGVA